MIEGTIRKLILKEDLEEMELKESFKEILEGRATPVQISAFLVALRMKGERPQEIAWAAQIMREKALKIDVYERKKSAKSITLDEDGDEIVFDTCGTGGAENKTFNISTSVAFVLAGCGIKVAKHGNRAVSSRCGSADILEALGINIEIEPEKVKEAIKEIGIGFLYAPIYHSSMKYATPIRRELGIRSIFNLLGPLSNPASCNYQLLGVYTKELTFLLAKVLRNLGLKKAFVVFGEDNIDEISITSSTFVSYLNKNRIRNFILRPEDFSKKRVPSRDIAGGSIKDNVRIIEDVLQGKRGPARDIVEINSSACLYLCGRAKTFQEGVRLSQECIDKGRALEKLHQLREFTHQA